MISIARPRLRIWHLSALVLASAILALLLRDPLGRSVLSFLSFALLVYGFDVRLSRPSGVSIRKQPIEK